MATLAQKLKVKPPSLYNHVEGLEGLKHALALRGLEELSLAMQRAAMGRAGRDALRAVSGAYRDFATRHPGLYPLTLRAPASEDEARKRLGGSIIETLLAVLRGYGLEGDEAVHAIRALRGALHGFVSLELQGGFGLPLDVDESFERLLTLLDQGLNNGFGGDEESPVRPQRVSDVS